MAGFIPQIRCRPKAVGLNARLGSGSPPVLILPLIPLTCGWDATGLRRPTHKVVGMQAGGFGCLSPPRSQLATLEKKPTFMVFVAWPHPSPEDTTFETKPSFMGLTLAPCQLAVSGNP